MKERLPKLKLIFQLNWLETAEEIDDLFLGDAEVCYLRTLNYACYLHFSLFIYLFIYLFFCISLKFKCVQMNFSFLFILHRR